MLYLRLWRAEDLAGLFIVAVIALSSILAAWQSIERLFNPQALENLWWVLADGEHARTDGFTSLAVVLGAVGVMLGFPLADPIIGLLTLPPSHTPPLLARPAFWPCPGCNCTRSGTASRARQPSSFPTSPCQRSKRPSGMPSIGSRSRKRSRNSTFW